MSVNISRLNTSQSDFAEQMDQLLAWESVSDAAVQQTVVEIVTDVRQRGDAAVIEYTNRFDRTSVSDIAELELSQEQLQAALDGLSDQEREALLIAAERVRQYHDKQKQDSWQYQENDGTVLGQKVTPMDRVGIYVPGGKAAYPSSVLMNAIPAHVAGVAEIIMVVPTPDGELNQASDRRECRPKPPAGPCSDRPSPVRNRCHGAGRSRYRSRGRRCNSPERSTDRLPACPRPYHSAGGPHRPDAAISRSRGS